MNLVLIIGLILFSTLLFGCVTSTESGFFYHPNTAPDNVKCTAMWPGAFGDPATFQDCSDGQEYVTNDYTKIPTGG